MAGGGRVNLISGETKHSACLPSSRITRATLSKEDALRYIPKWAPPPIHVFDPLLLGNIGVMTPDICSPRAGGGRRMRACMSVREGRRIPF